MTDFGYHASHGQFPPANLLRFVRRSQECGFTDALAVHNLLDEPRCATLDIEDELVPMDTDGGPELASNDHFEIENGGYGYRRYRVGRTRL